MPTCPFKTKFIINPKAGGGKAGWEWPKVADFLTPIVGKPDVEFTTGPGLATILTRRFLEDHYQLIVAVGGDGTVNEVVNGFFENESQLNPEAILGILPIGSGSDFTRSLGYPPEWEKAAEKLGTDACAIMDVGRIKCLGMRGEEYDRYFANVVDFGLGSQMLASVKNQSKLFGSKVQFFLGAAKALMSFKNDRIRYRIDDGQETEKVVNSMVIANGQFFGAGKWVAPHARLDDGRLDVVIMDKMEQMEAVKKMQLLDTGAHLGTPGVTYTQASTVYVDSPDPIMIDMDGNPLGRLPCTVSVIQQVVRVKI